MISLPTPLNLLSQVKDEQNGIHVYDLFLLAFLVAKTKESKIFTSFLQRAEESDEAAELMSAVAEEAISHALSIRGLGGVIPHPDYAKIFRHLPGDAYGLHALALLKIIENSTKPSAHQYQALTRLNQNFHDLGSVYLAPKEPYPTEPENLHRKRVRQTRSIGSRLESQFDKLLVLPKGIHDYEIAPIKIDREMRVTFRANRFLRIAAFSPQRHVAAEKADINPLTDEEGNEITDLRNVHVKQSPEIKKRIERFLKACERSKINIAVFPEYSFTRDLEEHCRQCLKKQATAAKRPRHLQLVVGGSMLVSNENCLTVLDNEGDDVCDVFKLNQYQNETPAWTEAIELPEQRRITVVETPIGRLAIVICVDFLVPEVLYTLSDLRCNILLVPAMTESTVRFHEHARWHGTLSSAMTIAVNARQFTKAKPNKKNSHSFGYLPFFAIEDENGKKPDEPDPELSYLSDSEDWFLIVDTQTLKIESRLLK